MVTSEKRQVAVPGGVIAYEVAGSGPVVLCLPSVGDTRREYEVLAPALLEAGYRVILTDLRGMGESRGKFKSHSLRDLTDDIKAILDAEKIDKAFLAGCSVSGPSAGLFAIENPQRVLGMVLFSPISHTGPKLQTGLLVAVLRVPGLGKGIWMSYFKSLYPLKPLNKEYLDAQNANLSQPGSMKSIADMCATPRLDARLTEIKAPTLIFFGTKDPDFKDVQAEAKLTQEQMPQAKITILEGIGHYPQRECPELVLPQVKEWLATVR